MSEPERTALRGQLRFIQEQWPALVAAVFARFDPGDQKRWSLLESDFVDPPGLHPGSSATLDEVGTLRSSETVAALGLLTYIARYWPAPEARDVLATVRCGLEPLCSGAAPEEGPSGVHSIESDATGRSVVELLIIGSTRLGDPRYQSLCLDYDRVTAAEGSSLEDHLEQIVDIRPWPDNPVYRSIVAGDYSPEQLGIYLDQWQLHLAAGPSLFAGILSATEPESPEHRRLLADLTERGPSGVEDRRTYLARSLGILRHRLTGTESPSPISPLAETTGHLGLVRWLTLATDVHVGLAAVSGPKVGFAATCREVAAALVRHYGLKPDEPTFFIHQADRNDTGDRERRILAAAVARDAAAQHRIVRAFADGLRSYHLILDGCHREALRLPG